MSARRLGMLALAALALAAPAGAPAHALLPMQVVAYSGGYLPSEVTVVAGGTLTLTNADPTLWHDLVSLDRGPGGVYLFRSDVIGPAQQAPVAGVERLAPSVYPFYCSVHEYMVGNITVVAPGA